MSDIENASDLEGSICARRERLIISDDDFNCDSPEPSHATVPSGSVMNCLFNNPKSSRFFPRLHNEEEWNNGLDCMGIQEKWYWFVQYEDCTGTKENRLKYYSLF